MAISMKIAVLPIELLLVRLRIRRASPWIGRVAPHHTMHVARRSEIVLIEVVFRLNEAEPGQEAVTPMQT